MPSSPSEKGRETVGGLERPFSSGSATWCQVCPPVWLCTTLADWDSAAGVSETSRTTTQSNAGGRTRIDRALRQQSAAEERQAFDFGQARGDGDGNGNGGGEGVAGDRDSRLADKEEILVAT